MHAVPWYIVIVISIPQTLLIMGLGFRLFNLPLNIQSFVVAPILVAIASYLFRFFHISYAINIILLLLIAGLALTVLVKHRFAFCLISLLLGFIIYMVLEMMSIAAFLVITGLNYDILIINAIWNIGMFIPIAIINALLWILVVRYNIILFDLSRQG